MLIEADLSAPLLLIAVPQLGDRHFMRGVVLILEHGVQGSMGLLINRPSNFSMDAFCLNQGLTFNSNQASMVYMGGPVQTDRAFVLHESTHEGPETQAISENLRFSYSLETLRLLAEQPPAHCRAFLGYAGWGPGQLAAEIGAGAWLTTQLVEQLVFAPADENVWESALGTLGIQPAHLMHSSMVH